MDLKTRLARICQVIMGLVFVVSGLIKVWEPVLFYWDVAPYAQLLGGLGPAAWQQWVVSHWQSMAAAALFLAPLECVLGAALLANWRPRVVFPAAVVLMGFFLGLMVRAWYTGATEECGCFGALLERGPGAAAVEDTVMLALLLCGWWGMRRQPQWPLAGGAVLATTIVAFALGGVRLGSQASRLTATDLQPGVRLTGLRARGLEVDLMRGEFLIELLSPACGHCVASVPKVNQYVQQPGLPRVVGLNTFAPDSRQLAQFKEEAQPLFPIGTISRTDFFRLTHGRGFPRLAYLRDGVVRRVWERDEFPTPEQITELMSGG
ncbi:MAG: MauE/DoxX family redox-associated membrane protein [Candidatus Latescibacterota bacterium]